MAFFVPTFTVAQLSIKCKDVLSIGVKRLLVGNRVSLGFNRSTIRPLPPSLFPVKEAT